MKQGTQTRTTDADTHSETTTHCVRLWYCIGAQYQTLQDCVSICTSKMRINLSCIGNCINTFIGKFLDVLSYETVEGVMSCIPCIHLNISINVLHIEHVTGDCSSTC